MRKSKEEIANDFQGIQDFICDSLKKADHLEAFQEDKWERPEGGGGRTRIIKNEATIEKGGVNFSAVHGKTPEKILAALKLEEADFFATGVSIVMHPQNPFCPIIHMNIRYFEMSNGISWFGGGIDLTPHYINAEDASFFHSELKKRCDTYDASYYAKFKQWADDYFFIKHRNETRGIGGIFFDRLSPTDDKSFDGYFNFVSEVGKSFPVIYNELLSRNKDKPFISSHKEWQALRRSRYVEFNLVYDKGTKFGLDTNGRVESILMSMPPIAQWEYDYQPTPNSEEEFTLNNLKKGIDWIA
ncbi:MAG: oxygen-dependent coproporphyrinogen oxidase [Cyclobacteriaceae bacterium]